VTEERVKRKLTAIFSADVQGYSRLMGEYELGTIETLKEYRKVMARLIKKYQGRVVDSTGDNLLAEFTSVVNAVESAVEIQKELKVKNADLPENRRMEFRIGINLGDVVILAATLQWNATCTLFSSTTGTSLSDLEFKTTGFA
jgi:adenylate cyclase